MDVRIDAGTDSGPAQASFAASHTRRQGNHGNSASPATLASDHVLAASKTALDLEVEKRRCCEVRCPAQGAMPAPAPAPVPSAWHNYVKSRGHVASLAQCSQEWHALSESQKRSWQPEPGQAQAAQLHGRRVRRRVPQPGPHEAELVPVWPGCGDAYYPVREELLIDAPSEVKALSAAWAERIGGETLKPCQAFDAPPVRSCEELFGRGCCSEALGQEVKDKLLLYQKRLDRWSRLTQTKPASFDAMWSPLPLFYLGPAPGAACASGEAPGLAALLLFPRMRHQVLCVQPCAPPQPGDIITFRPDIGSLQTNVQFAWSWSRAHVSVTCKIKYSQVGLAAFQVVELIGMSELEAKFAKERAAALQATRLANLMTRAAPKRFTRRDGGKPQPRAAQGPRVQQPEDDSADIDFDDAMQLADEEMYAEGVGDSDGNDDDDNVPTSELEQMMNDLAAQRDDGEDAPGSSSDDEGDDDEPQLGRGLPSLDPDTGQVRSADNPAEQLGRISLIKEGTRQEAVSLYCRRHGCAMMRSVRAAPSTAELLQWFADGQQVPAERTAAAQSRHKAMFPK